MSSPRDFPFPSPPLVAPFWIDLDHRVNGAIYYRNITNLTLIDEINFAVNIYNGFRTIYTSRFSVIVTWDNVPLALSGESTGIVQALITTDGIESYVFFAYSASIFPNGAVIGINAGDGVNFILQSSMLLGNSNNIAFETNVAIFQVRGIYLFRLDNLGAPTPTTSTPPSCSNGDLILDDVSQISQTDFTGVPLVCIDGTLGGICSTGFDGRDALVICRNLAMPFNATVSGKFRIVVSEIFVVIV